MSLTSFVAQPEVAARLTAILPKRDAIFKPLLRAPPVTSHYGLIGTAFDYALRFELQRRNPHATTKHWVAEASLGNLRLFEKFDDRPPEPGLWGREAARAEMIVKDARGFIDGYVKIANPGRTDFEELAKHAIRLAKLDLVYRIGLIEPDMEAVDPGDVQDLVAQLSLTPYAALSHPKILWLNPLFESYSALVGGADADLIVGNALIDIKSTKNFALERKTLHQLVGYLILARGARKEKADYPAVDKLGLYFSRYGHLWTLPAAAITSHPAFEETESWFVDHARQQLRERIETRAAKSRQTREARNQRRAEK